MFSRKMKKCVNVLECKRLCSSSADEEYGDDKPKKVRAAPREPKHKRSKNSQDDRWALM